MPVPAAFPFIEIRIDTSGLTPIAQRSPGVIAVVGRSAAGAADPNVPYEVSVLADATNLFGVGTPLTTSLQLALLQDPRPSKIYGVKAAGTNYAAALSGLEAADDVTFVSLAGETDVGAPAAGATPATNLRALKQHVENMSAEGQRRLGVAMIDPTRAKGPSYVTDATAAVAALKSTVSRMVLVAARGAVEDVATAAMAAMAGFEPHISMVLKKVRGVTMPLDKQYSPSEIKGLSEQNINPIIDPALIVGESLHFAEGRTFTTDADLLFIDIVRVLDDIEFRLKAGLIGLAGDARITKQGLTRIRVRMDEILSPLKQREVIADYSVDIPALNILNLPESAWSPADRSVVVTARANRTVDMYVSVTYGPAVHRLKVTLAPKF